MVKRELTLSDGTVVVAEGWAYRDKRTGHASLSTKWVVALGRYVHVLWAPLRRNNARKLKQKYQTIKRVYVER